MIPGLITSHICTADVAAFLIVKFSDAAASNKVAQAAANTDPMMGVSDRMGGVSGNTVDVQRSGRGQVRLGGTVQAGDPLTSDANGNAVKLLGAAGATRRMVGWAEEPGVADDVIDALIAPGILQLPA